MKEIDSQAILYSIGKNDECLTPDYGVKPIIKYIPKNAVGKFVKLNASGIKSKHTIEIISPDANAKTKLKNFFDVFLKVTPIIPPIVVPNVPKKSPINVVFSRLFIYNLPSKGIK